MRTGAGPSPPGGSPAGGGPAPGTSQAGRQAAAAPARSPAPAARPASRTGGTAVTVAGICARAGIATGSFYAHFSSKAEIFAAVVRQINADLRMAMRTALEQA